MEAAERIQTYLGKLGVEPDAVRVYIELLERGHSSALQLARATGTSRTQTYRYLDDLKAKGLASAEQLSYGTYFQALPIENIDGLLADREAETLALRHDLPGVSALLQQLAGSQGPTATVHHYYGLAGLKQVNWNLTKASGEYRVFEAAHLSQHLDKTFARRCREKYIERGLTSYDLTNAAQVSAAEIEPFNPAKTHIRRVDEAVLKINFEVYIYNDVVTLLDYSREDPLAIEIHHAALHAMMRQLFDAMWNTAQPIPVSS